MKKESRFGNKPSNVIGQPRRRVWGIAVAGAALAIAVRWYFVAHALVLQPLDNPNAQADAVEYYRYAWNLLHHGVFSLRVPTDATPTSDSFRDPGYPLFLSLWMALTNGYEQWFSGVLLAQCALGGVTVGCIVLAVRDELPDWALIMAAALAALWPHSVSITACVLSENLTAALFAGALLALRQATIRPSLAHSLIAGLLLAFAGLTNAVLAPLVVVLAVIVHWKRVMKPRQIAILALAGVLPLVAWTARNTTVPTGATASFRAKLNLVEGSWPTYHDAERLWAIHDPVGIQTVAAIDAEATVMENSLTAGLSVMTSRMKDHPGTYLGWYLSKPALLWGWDIGIGQGDIYVYPTRNSPFITQPAMRSVEAAAFVLNPLIGFLALLAVLTVTLIQKPPVAILIAACTAAWITLVYGVLQSDPRFTIPFRGIEIALALFTVTRLIAWARLYEKIPPS